jgi:hypothetical protein
VAPAGASPAACEPLALTIAAIKSVFVPAISVAFARSWSSCPLTVDMSLSSHSRPSAIPEKS